MKVFLNLVASSCVFLCAQAYAAGVADFVEIDEATVRATAPGVPVGGAYMKIKNADSTNHSLVAAHSDVASSVELHNHVMEDGMMKMRKQDSVALPKGGTVVFEPGGLHIMLIGLTGPMTAGESVGIELEFEDGSRKHATFFVR